MTRELKLALIVGFALVLTVAVLVSDHLSRANRAEMAQAEPTTRVVAQAPQSPIRALEELTPSRVPSAVQTDNVNTGGALTRDPGPDEITMQDAINEERRRAGLSGGMDEPVTISNGSAQRGTADPRRGDPLEGHSDLVNAANGQGVNLVPVGDGVKLEVPVTYTVKPGETLYGIAERIYGNGKYWKQLAQANNLGDGSGLAAGVTLKLPEINQAPQRTDVATATPEPRRSSTSDSPSRATPKPTAPVTPKNPKPTPTVNPSKTTPTPAVAKTTSYTVRKGDTLGVIAQRTLGSSKRADEIRKLNNLKDANNLIAGTTLKIPAK